MDAGAAATSVTQRDSRTSTDFAKPLLEGIHSYLGWLALFSLNFGYEREQNP
jgi:hypothetical protein